jgi:hypothetical protein
VRASSTIAIALFLIAGTSSAQSGLTGNWSGTYTASIQIAACQNKTFTWSGNASVALLHGSAALTGRIDLTNFTRFSSNCSTSSGEITTVVIGTSDGSTLNLIVPNDPNSWQFTGSADANGIVLQLSDPNGLTGSFNLARTSDSVPAADITGTWSGNYTFSDRCPNGGSKSYNGAFTLAATQSNGRVGGVLTMANVPLYDQNCSTLTTLNMALSVAGTVSGATFNGVAYDPSGSFDFPITATIGGSGISGSASGASTTSTSGTFTLTPSSAQHPAADFSGLYDGNYSELDDARLFCLNISGVNYNGTATVLLVQAGSAVSGAVVQDDTIDIVSDGFGNCVAINGGQKVLPLYGTLANGSLSTTFPFGSAAASITANLSGDSVTGTMTDSVGDTMSFSTSRSAVPVTPPLSRRRAVRP